MCSDYASVPNSLQNLKISLKPFKTHCLKAQTRGRSITTPSYRSISVETGTYIMISLQVKQKYSERNQGSFRGFLSSGQFYRPFPEPASLLWKGCHPFGPPELPGSAKHLSSRVPAGLSGQPMADASCLAIPPLAATLANRNGRMEPAANGSLGRWRPRGASWASAPLPRSRSRRAAAPYPWSPH